MGTFPLLSSYFPIISPPLFFSDFSFPCSPLRRGSYHLLRLGGLGERFSPPSGSGRSPAAKQYLVNFTVWGGHVPQVPRWHDASGHIRAVANSGE